jgi:cytochrome c5
MQQWAASCALCHAAGEAGAPVVGKAEQWRPRLEQGREVLLTHSLEGYNRMPPLGYCMSCETEDFLAMIDFMAGG